MKLFTDKGKEIGRTLSKNMLEINLQEGGKIMLGGTDYTVSLVGLSEGDSFLAICSNGEIATDILPKEVQNGEQTGTEQGTGSTESGDQNGESESSSDSSESGTGGAEVEVTATGEAPAVPKAEDNAPAPATNTEGSADPKVGESSERRSYTKL